MRQPENLLEREAARLRQLHHYDILDTPPDGAYDRITRLVSKLLDVPVAIISLVDHDRIWFKSHCGVDADQVDKAPGLCVSAIMQDSFYELNDALNDPRSLTNPLVAGEMGVRFYLGYPLTTPDGFNLGMLCALDFVPREASDLDREILETLAAAVMEQMNLRVSARRIHELNNDLLSVQERLRYEAQHDALTGLFNRGMISVLLDKSLGRSHRDQSCVSVIMMDIDLFKSINDTWGHSAGDEVLIETARRLENAMRKCDAVGRIGGEEFLVILEETGVDQSLIAAERMRSLIADTPYTILGPEGPIEVEVTVSLGVCSKEPGGEIDASKMLRHADDGLYRAKQLGRNRIEGVLPC